MMSPATYSSIRLCPCLASWPASPPTTRLSWRKAAAEGAHTAADAIRSVLLVTAPIRVSRMLDRRSDRDGPAMASRLRLGSCISSTAEDGGFCGRQPGIGEVR